MSDWTHVRRRHVKNFDGTPACGKDISAFCQAFLIPLPAPQQLPTGQIMMQMVQQLVVIQPLLCPHCQQPLYGEKAQSVIVPGLNGPGQRVEVS